ncbi:MAG TPA: MarR family winged helix-turn-helix transcriptional regulator [Steroidobacteraceae bacterium]
MRDLLEELQGIEGGLARIARHIPDIPTREILLIRLLRLSAEGLGDTLTTLLSPHDLNESEFRTLMQLFSSPSGSAYPGDLCPLVAQMPTNMTRITGVLLRRKFITRGHAQQDRRRVQLCITAAGRRFVSALLPQLFPVVRTSFAALSETERQTLQRLLQQLVTSIGRASSESARASTTVRQRARA